MHQTCAAHKSFEMRAVNGFEELTKWPQLGNLLERHLKPPASSPINFDSLSLQWNAKWKENSVWLHNARRSGSMVKQQTKLSRISPELCREIIADFNYNSSIFSEPFTMIDHDTSGQRPARRPRPSSCNQSWREPPKLNDRLRRRRKKSFNLSSHNALQ